MRPKNDSTQALSWQLALRLMDWVRPGPGDFVAVGPAGVVDALVGVDEGAGGGFGVFEAVEGSYHERHAQALGELPGERFVGLGVAGRAGVGEGAAVVFQVGDVGGRGRAWRAGVEGAVQRVGRDAGPAAGVDGVVGVAAPGFEAQAGQVRQAQDLLAVRRHGEVVAQ